MPQLLLSFGSGAVLTWCLLDRGLAWRRHEPDAGLHVLGLVVGMILAVVTRFF
jgi:hypothetical protein